MTLIRRGRGGTLLALLLLAALPLGCLPIPTIQRDIVLDAAVLEISPGSVRTEYVSLPSGPAPNTPEAYNRALYTRYYRQPPVGNASDTVLVPDTVLVMVPGLFSGATILDVLARQLVASQRGLEVWVLDRRANLLEDRSAFVASLERRDPTIAYDYYVRNVGTPTGFQPLSAEEVPFLRDWGIGVHLRDLHEVILAARALSDTVYLAGYSLGASQVGLYAAYRFGDTVGQDYIDGLILIDGGLGRSGAFGDALRLSVGPVRIAASRDMLMAGEGVPYATALGFDPVSQAQRMTVALLAGLEPSTPSPGGFFDVPLTNLAVLGLTADDDYSLAPVFSVAMGETTGAEFAGNLPAALLGGREGLDNRTVSGVARGFQIVGWQRSAGDDGAGNDGASNDKEPVDPLVFARSRVTLDTDADEWYFPLRLALDIAQFDISLDNEPDFIPNRDVTVPTLAVGAAKGLVPDLATFAAYSNVRAGSLFSSYILPGFTHVDIVYAEQNPLVPLMLRWLEQLRTLRGSP
ncbi:MAG: alpha/beta fold hydrolase [Trueperaceae bacterium]|nr:alpha/beta fold hydrolase [Trueperaceae bacterium]